jgi:hypothetical protein
MPRFEVSYNDKNVIFVNVKTGKADPIALIDPMTSGDAVRALQRENSARESGSRAAVSLLTEILKNPRFDGYRGVTPIHESIPKELKDAMREAEGEYMKPLFVAAHEEKGAKPATVAKLWDEYIGALRAGSSYAVAKGKVLAFYAHLGRLPVTDNGKLLSVAAIDKLLAMAKEDAQKPTAQGIAGKLVSLASQVRERTEKTEMGDPSEAIHALREMLATFEGLQREANEAALVAYEARTTGDVTAQASAAIAAAAAPAAALV